MARYSAPTTSTQTGDIDQVLVANRAVASAYSASAFMGLVNTFRAPSRNGLIIQRGGKTWTTVNLDGATAPDETVYNPTARSYECTGHGIDTVVTQEGMADGDSSGDETINAIVSELSVDYARYFDAKCAALYTEAKTTTHELGSSTSALTGPLIDKGIQALATSGAPERFALVIHTSKLGELMQIPGMRDKDVRGSAGAGGVDGPNLQGASSKLVVRGYGGGILDVYHSSQIVSSTGYHNMMFSISDVPEERTIQNPWFPLKDDMGLASSKLHLKIYYEPTRRVVEVIPTTQETWLGNSFSSTTNEWMVDLITA